MTTLLTALARRLERDPFEPRLTMFVLALAILLLAVALVT